MFNELVDWRLLSALRLIDLPVSAEQPPPRFPLFRDPCLVAPVSSR